MGHAGAGGGGAAMVVGGRGDDSLRFWLIWRINIKKLALQRHLYTGSLSASVLFSLRYFIKFVKTTDRTQLSVNGYSLIVVSYIL